MNETIKKEKKTQKNNVGGVVIADNPQEKFFILTPDGKTVEVKSQIEVARFFRQQKR